jgi:sulfite exporter TauE/SafE
LAAGVVLVAAGLLLTIIAQARTIARQVEEIDRSLERSRQNTDALFELGAVNETIHSVVERLRSPGRRAQAG